MSSSGAWTVIRPAELEFTPPSKGDPTRGVMRLSEHLSRSRANVWRMPPSSRGRRHLETRQEEVFVCLEGTATLHLGEPPVAIELTPGTVALVKPRTPVQLANDRPSDGIVLVLGAPPTVGDAEYLPDTSA